MLRSLCQEVNTCILHLHQQWKQECQAINSPACQHCPGQGELRPSAEAASHHPPPPCQCPLAAQLAFPASEGHPMLPHANPQKFPQPWEQRKFLQQWSAVQRSSYFEISGLESVVPACTYKVIFPVHAESDLASPGIPQILQFVALDINSIIINTIVRCKRVLYQLFQPPCFFASACNQSTVRCWTRSILRISIYCAVILEQTKFYVELQSVPLQEC